jgi:CHAD domain-containing protein
MTLTQTPTTTGELAIHILEQQVAAFLEHAPGARAGEDPLHVHQMRVATRRMRAALRLFSDVLPPEARSLNDELQWIAGQLGPCRDLDVHIRRTRESGAALGISAALVPYGAWLVHQRQQAQVALTAAMESPRFADLLHRLATLSALPLVGDLALSQDAPRRLRQARRKLKKRADRLDRNSPPPDLHQVRIRAKRLRYAAEFFEPLYGKPAQRLVKRLTALQDLLGDFQDGVVGGQRIREAVLTSAGAWPAETSLALGQVVQYDLDRSRKVRKRFPRAYDDVMDNGWRRLESKVAIS